MLVTHQSSKTSRLRFGTHGGFMHGAPAWMLLSGLLLAACGSEAVDGKDTTIDTAGQNLQFSQRVSQLLGEMTLQEKIGQMLIIDSLRVSGAALYDSGGGFDPRWMAIVFEQTHSGSILSGSGLNPDATLPGALAAYVNELQRYAIEHSRLGIPLLYGLDLMHGHNGLEGGTIFPHPIGLAASRDRELVSTLAEHTARSGRATGVNWTFGPVCDLGKDPRWGRFYETFGEDPLLNAELVAAAVSGYQGDPLDSHLAATAKHFVGYGSATGGLDRADAEISWRTLHDQHLLPFQAAVDASVKTVMATMGSVNGVPVTASHELLADVLRGDMGFDGVLVSDWQEPQGLFDRHGVAADLSEAYEQAIMAGIDVLMVPDNALEAYNTVLGLVQDGRVPEARIDAAAGRVLTLKEDLGLFDDPFVDVEAATEQTIGVDRELARRAAVESLVLLKNEGTLPIQPGAKVMLTGPSADNVANLMGGWTLGWQGLTEGLSPAAVTVREALATRLAEGALVYAPGVPPSGVTEPLLVESYRDEALALADGADLVVVVAGETPYAESLGDNPANDLPAEQEALILALSEAGIPVVLVLVAGRPLVIEPVIGAISGLVMAHLPGTEGGNAIADVLLGAQAPTGRLPYSWPRHTGQLPLNYNARTGINFADPQRPEPLYDPLFPFGFGLGFASVVHFSPSISDRELRSDETLTVWLEAFNTVGVPLDDIVELYVDRKQSSILTQPTQLVGFERVALGPYEYKTLELSFPINRLAVTPGDVFSSAPREVEPGDYTLYTPAGNIDFAVR